MSKNEKAKGKGKNRDTGKEADAAPSGADLAEEALKPKADVNSIEERIQALSPEDAELFAKILEITMKRRRVMLAGYLCALGAVLFGMIWSLYMYGSREPGTFVGWVFIVPPALAAVIIILFGRWANSIGK